LTKTCESAKVFLGDRNVEIKELEAELAEMLSNI
jgi:hypothetical protein